MSVPGVIVPTYLYRLDTLQKLTGIGRSGFRELRSKGLRVRYVGRGAWVLGADFIECVLENGQLSRQTAE